MESQEQLSSPLTPDAKDKNLALVYLCFGLSGFTSLIYELSWQRILLRILGSTLPAVTLVLCVFMCGLAVGSYLAYKYANRFRNPILAYGVMELIVGTFGVLSLWLFSSQPGAFVSGYDALIANLLGLSNVDSFEPFNGAFWSRAFFASTLLLVPTLAMGATFSFVSKFVEKTARAPQAQGCAYLCNLTGAAVGTVCAGFVLLPNLGLSVTITVASILNAVIFVVALARFSGVRLQHDKDASPDNCESGSLPMSSIVPIALAVLVNGAAGMTLEVVWSRLFSLLLGSSTYSVASVFAISIVGLALGTLLFQRLKLKIDSHRLWLAAIFCAVAACLYLDLWLIQLLPWFFNVNHSYLGSSNSFSGYLLERIFVISLVVLPPTIFCGTIFPLALTALSTDEVRKNYSGLLYTFSSLGSVLGAAAAGFIFVPLLGRIFPSGMESTIYLVLGLEICFAIYLFVAAKTNPMFFLLPLVLASLLFVRPSWNKSLIASGIPFLSLPTKAATTKEIFDRVLSDSANNKLLFYREGLNTTVTVSANLPQNIVYLKNDGKVEAALPFHPQRQADTSDLSTHIMLGRLPLSANSAPEKNVFLIGLGSGATCGGALADPSVKRLKVAEIEPTIFEIQHYFEPANGEPTRPEWLKNGRVVPFCGDARMSLDFGKEKYDVIISQPAEPWISGSSDLYTTEFWNLAKSKLNARGCFCQWIQLYSIDPEFLAVLLRTFQNVFPNTYIYHYPRAGEIIVLGTLEPFDQGYSNPNLIADAAKLRKNCEITARKFNDFRLNTDDNLLTEYALPPRLYLSESLIEENLLSILSDK